MGRSQSLAARILLLLVSVEIFSHVAAAESAASRSLPAKYCWEPAWRDKGDCGPIALHVLFRLLGRRSSIPEVKQAVPFDAMRGCSLADLDVAARKFGVPVEVRFVNPRDLPSLPGPYILHAKVGLQDPAGHFLVVTGHSNSRGGVFATINTSDATFDWVPEASVASTFSGYVLTPASAQGNSPPTQLAISLLLGGALAWLTRTWRTEPTHGSHQAQAAPETACGS